MKINREACLSITHFEDLEAGDVFQLASGSIFWIRIHRIGEIVNCCDLSNGQCGFVESSNRVIPVDGEFVVKP